MSKRTKNIHQKKIIYFYSQHFDMHFIRTLQYDRLRT